MINLRRKILFLLLLGLLNLIVCGCDRIVALQYAWTKTFGGPDGIGGHHHAIAVDDLGAVYIAGGFNDAVDFDPGRGNDIRTATQSGSVDIFLTKITTSGTYAWTMTFGGTGWDEGLSVAVDASGNVYLTGYFSNTVDFDPGIGEDIKTATGWYDIFLTKITTDGHYVWTKVFHGNKNHEYGHALTVDRSDNIYITGSFKGSVDFNPDADRDIKNADDGDIFLVKILKDGRYAWVKTFGAGGGSAVAVDTSGNIYVTGGLFRETGDFDPGPEQDIHTGVGRVDIFLTKFTADGVYEWTKVFGGNEYDFGQAIGIDPLGNIYVTGYFSETVDFDPGVGVNATTAAGALDIFLSKFSPTGEYAWTWTFGGWGKDAGDGLAVDTLGHVYITGAKSRFYTGKDDIILAKITPDGSTEWIERWGGHSHDWGEGIAISPFGAIYVMGRFGGTVDFDIGSPTDKKTAMGEMGDLDLFVTKYFPE